MFLLVIFISYLKSLTAFVGGYVIVDEKLPRFVVPDLTDFKVIAFRCSFFLGEGGRSHFTYLDSMINTTV
jgi:hypothetical protein